MSKLIPLTDAQLRVKAPSIFAESAIDNVSSQYNFVPTHEVLRTFKEAGYYPILAGEAKSRNSENQPYVKHLIQFRSLENLLSVPKDGLYYDLCLKNSHNKTSSFTLELSCFRLICENLLTISTDQLVFHRIIHKGFQSSKITRAIDEIVNYIPTVQKEIENLKQITLNDVEATAVSKAAIDIRFDTDTHEINPQSLLTINRIEDFSPTAFNIYNRVQEAIINGGIKLKHKVSQKVQTSKAITAIDEKSRLNKELYKTMLNLASLKSEHYEIAA